MKAASPATATASQIRHWRQQARDAAEPAGVNPQEVDWLLRYGAGVDRLHLQIARGDEKLSLRRSLAQLNQLWARRLGDRVPLQYLVGAVPWRNFELKVSPDVLIPRPETEAIVDLAVEAVGKDRGGVWVDLGTGSGAIALGLVAELPQSTVIAVDRSPAALAVARENAQRHGLSDRLQFRCGSWFAPLDDLKGQLRGMVSNPPYIPSDLVLELQPEVTRHEPHLALDGGDDGLQALRQLVNLAPDYLQPGGVWLVELMSGQSDAVCQLLRDNGNYEEPQVVRDLDDRDRFVLSQRRTS